KIERGGAWTPRGPGGGRRQGRVDGDGGPGRPPLRRCRGGPADRDAEKSAVDTRDRGDRKGPPRKPVAVNERCAPGQRGDEDRHETGRSPVEKSGRPDAPRRVMRRSARYHV